MYNGAEKSGRICEAESWQARFGAQAILCVLASEKPKHGEIMAAKTSDFYAELYTEDQAKKSTGWMPWRQEPKKDVTSCDKPRRGANIQ